MNAAWDDDVRRAAGRVPAGAWGVAVSGGADSVALLLLLRERVDLRPHVLHLNHEARGEQSDADARFVADLADRLGLPFTVARRGEVEPALPHAPRNRQARFRRLRLRFFADAAARHGLAGVVLAHHADDQAETIVQRILRRSGPFGLCGMRMRTRIGGLLLLRPCLDVRRDALRAALTARGQPWREDPSNASPAAQRSRVRALLRGDEALTGAALAVGRAARRLRSAAMRAAARWGEQVPLREVRRLHELAARAALARWARRSGAPAARVDGAVVTRLLALCLDAASAPRITLPGGVVIARAAGRLRVLRRPG